MIMKITGIPVGEVGTNCYLLKREDCEECILIDPGADADRIVKLVEKHEAKVVAIILTHGHYDHMMAIDELRERYGVKVYVSENDRELMSDARMNFSMFVGRNISRVPDLFIEDNEELQFAGIKLLAMATPGHTAGSMCFYIKDENVLISGDTLFRASVGRTDLPTGDHKVLIESIKSRLMTLPDDTKVLPGHGFSTTIGYERENNMFINGDL